MVFVNVTYVERILDVNRKVTIVILEGHYRGRYPSRIEDMGQVLLLAAPTRKGAVVRLNVGEPIRVEILAKGGVYAFDAYVDSITLEPIPIIGVGAPENFSRIQRREFVRVAVNLPVKYRPLKPASEDPSGYKSAHIVNLSGGGARIAIWHVPKDGDLDEDKNLDVGSRLQLEFELPCGSKIKAEAVIIRIAGKRTEKGMCHNIAVEFTEIDQKEQDDIARHVLECQYEMRRKGLL